MDKAPDPRPPNVTQVVPSTRSGRATRFVRHHAIGLSFIAFTLAFCALLQFDDPNNLEFFLRASSYLVVGRNPYAILPFPAPPGLFLPALPAFAVYAASGYDLALASFTLKLVNLAALLVLTAAAARLASQLGLAGAAIGRLRTTLLLSPLVFFVSFVWVEQDVVGLAITMVALLALLRGGRSTEGRWEEAAGFGLIAFASFTYYFPAAIVPTLLVYSRSTSQLLRRAVLTVVSFGGFGLWFLIRPGWNFTSNALGVTGANGNISYYSVVTLLGSDLFDPATSLQSQVVAALVVVLIVLEISLPIFFRWKNVSWEVSVAVAFSLPFLLLNILNADEYVWPLPFLLLALLALKPTTVRSVHLWLLQAYALPTMLVVNMFNAPGPGAGSGVFYFGYTQFQNAVTVYPLVPDFTVVTRVASVLSWLAILLVIIVILFLDRSRWGTGPAGDTAPRPAAERASDGLTSVRTGWRIPRSRQRTVGAILVVAAAVTLIASVVPGPTLTASSSDRFPVGLFSAYPVANGSVSYSIGTSGNAVSVAPNFGNWTSLPTPWRTVNFSRNVAGEKLSLDLGVDFDAPSWFPVNSTVVAYGDAALNAVVPFVPLPPSARLSPVISVNVSQSPAITSAQIAGSISGGLVYNGSSFTNYDATPLTLPGGQLTLLFRWSGIGLLQNVVMTLYRGDVAYQLYGVNDTYIAGVKPVPGGAWTFATPQLVNPMSWHELTLTNSSNGTDLALDGMTIPLPPVPISSERQGANLVVGSVDTVPREFQRFDFWGTIAGPYNTTGDPPALGAPLWCAVTPESENPAVDCTGFSTSYLAIRSDGSQGVSVQTPSATFWLNSTEPVFQFGRLSLVGPAMELQLRSLSLSTANSWGMLAWVVDGVVVAPAVLMVLIWPRRIPPSAES